MRRRFKRSFSGSCKQSHEQPRDNERPLLPSQPVVTVALLAMVIGILLKSNMREQRIASMTPVSPVAEASLGLSVEN
jgi:hypothetical protein